MSGKTDTDIEEFVTAWMVAMAMHDIAAKPADSRKALARRPDYEDRAMQSADRDPTSR